MQRYIVLRNLASARTSEPFESAGPRATTRGLTFDDIPEPKLESHELTTREVADIAREYDVQAVTPEMVTSLIEPVPLSGGAAAAAAGDSWGVAAVKANTSRFTGEGVVVAVLDTGIDRAHPAFAGVQITERDFTNTSVPDGHGHGTHCAGTIFGRDVEGRRIGIARGVSKALIGKVLKDSGSGSSESIFEGLKWAVQEGANVVSMSIGFDFSKTVQKALDQGMPLSVATSHALEAYRGNLRMFDALMAMIKANEVFGKGAVIVAASGNESKADVDAKFKVAASVPAAANGVVSVGAVAQGTGGLAIAPFSNTFPQLCAPGVAVVSARRGGGLVAMNGTSMACPHVAGVAALWWEQIRKQNLRPSPNYVIARLLNAQLDNVFLPNTSREDYGAGLVMAPQ